MMLCNYQPIPVIRRYNMETSRSFIFKAGNQLCFTF